MKKREMTSRGPKSGDDKASRAPDAHPEATGEIPDLLTTGTRTKGFGKIPDFGTFDDVDPEFGQLVKAFLEKVVEVALTLEIDPELGGRDDRIMRAAAMLGAKPKEIGDGRTMATPSAPARPNSRARTDGKTLKGNRTTKLSRTEAEGAMTVRPMYRGIVLRGELLDGNSLALVTAERGAMREEGAPEEELDAFAKEALSWECQNVLRTVGSRVRILWKPSRSATGRRAGAVKDSKEYRRDKGAETAVHGAGAGSHAGLARTPFGRAALRRRPKGKMRRSTP